MLAHTSTEETHMANVPAGLFASPEQAQRAEENRFLELFSKGGPGLAAAGAGRALAGAATRGLGGDSRSLPQKRASQVQEIAKQIDFRNPESIRQGMELMNQGGFQAEGSGRGW